MARYDYDDPADHLSAVAQSCKYLKAGAGAQGKASSEGVSCSICSSWDGNSCARRAFENTLDDLDID